MRRLGLFLLVLVGLVGIAAVARQPAASGVPALEWCMKGQTLPANVALLIEFGLKDTEPTDWNGKATVERAKVVHREGYRFRSDDKIIAPDGWEMKSHRPIRVPRGQPAVARTEGIATVGVVLHLADVKPDAKVTVNAAGQEAGVALADVLTGQPSPIFDGKAQIRRVSCATPVAVDDRENDFPAAAYGPDGTLWVAYIGYHVRDGKRRIEQAQYDQQPTDFKSLYTPEFADQLFLRSCKDGKWSEPLPLTDARQDLVRCAVAVDGDETVIVVYSANRNGRFDLYARPIRDGKPGTEQRLTGGGDDSSTGVISPVMCTSNTGSVHLAALAASKQGWGLYYLSGIKLKENGWSARMAGGIGAGDGSSWHPAIAAGPDDRWQIACDGYRQGDYDVVLAIDGTSSRSTGKLLPVAGSSRFEARPSLAFDAKGRLWIAYEDGPELWGKDFGAFDEQDGNPLYSAHSVRVLCLENGQLKRPVADLPTSQVRKPMQIGGDRQPGPGYERGLRYSHPHIGIDGKGRVWLTYRQKFGSRYSSHAGSYWLSFARRLDGDRWTEPMEILHSDGLLDYRPAMLPHASGGLLMVHNTDCRYTEPEIVANRIYASVLDRPGDPVEPKLVAHEAGQKDPKTILRAGKEAEALRRIREYRVDLGNKKLQLLRGEFHRHTEISWDGGPDGSLEDMFRYAIDAAGMDWIGNGDHDNGAGREYSWWLTQKLTDAYHVNGAFTPMFTYERSVAYPHGHRNCMFAHRGVRTLPRLAEPDMQKRVGGVHADDAKMLYRYLHEMKGICAGHTCATGMGTDWRDNDPVVEPFVEIYQGDRMSYEYESCPRAGFDPKGNQLPHQIGGWQPLGFLTHAFKKGYRLGFQSSSDHWSTHISYCIALAERHDREAILDAYRKRHCYGATDDIILDVRCGAHIMGDEFKSADAPTLQITAIGTGPLAAVDVLRDSEVVHTIEPKRQEYKGTWTDPKPQPGTHYYYVRVRQADGELAWGSPMWIDFNK